jgi:hypothetical protein
MKALIQVPVPFSGEQLDEIKKLVDSSPLPEDEIKIDFDPKYHRVEMVDVNEQA